MIRLFATLLTGLLSIPSFALTLSCPQAVPTNNPAFCQSFKQVAECHCVEAGLPKGMCNNMKTIYQRMIGIYGTVERACKNQHDTSTQNCIDDWKCYRNGGNNSNGEPCSNTGKKCE